MYYILNSDIALRSWTRSPYAYYHAEDSFARRLTREEYDLLSQCDGTQDLADGPLLHALAQRGLCIPCEKGERALGDWQRKVYANRYFPKMNWMITGKCNCNCLHCFNAADNAPLQSEWTLEEAQHLLDQARDCGINAFTITGGEPMLHPHFFEILEGIYRRHMVVDELNTNGFFITQEALDRLRAIGCKPLIKISFDGLGHHDWLRNQKGAEDIALRAIRLCIENHVRVMLQTNVHRKNLQAMLPTVEYMDALGVERMRIIRTTESPRWAQNAHGATLSLAEYYDEMMKLWQHYAAGKHQMDLTVWQLGTMYPKRKEYDLAAAPACADEYRDSLPVCKGNRGMIAVAANGNVFPCHQMSGYYEQHNDVLGNLKTGSLQELLTGGRYMDEVCTTVGTLREKNHQCGSCRHFTYCLGGCRAIALALTGDKLAADPSKCLFWNGDYYQRIRSALPGYRNLSVIESMEQKPRQSDALSCAEPQGKQDYSKNTGGNHNDDQ